MAQTLTPGKNSAINLTKEVFRVGGGIWYIMLVSLKAPPVFISAALYSSELVDFCIQQLPALHAEDHIR